MSIRFRTNKTAIFRGCACLDRALSDTYTLPFAPDGSNLGYPDYQEPTIREEIKGTEIRAMPNHKSAEKRVRQNEKRRDVNRNNRGRLRTSIRKLRAALTSADANAVQELLPATISTIDKAVQKGVLHRNAAARYKSRLTTRVNQANAK